MKFKPLLETWEQARKDLEEVLDEAPKNQRNILKGIFHVLKETAESLYVLTRNNHQEGSWRSLKEIHQYREALFTFATQKQQELEGENIPEAIRKARLTENNIRKLMGTMLLARKTREGPPKPQKVLKGKLLLEKAASYKELERKWRTWLNEYLQRQPDYAETLKKKEEMSLSELARLFRRSTRTSTPRKKEKKEKEDKSEKPVRM